MSEVNGACAQVIHKEYQEYGVPVKTLLLYYTGIILVLIAFLFSMIYAFNLTYIT